MDFKEVDLETPAGTLADSLAQIFIMTTSAELRQQAYRMVDVDNNRDFALAVEARLNKYFKSKQRKLDRRSILQIREEMDDASVILEYFLKSAGLPSDAVEKFSSKKLSARIKMLEKTANQKSIPKSYTVCAPTEMEHSGVLNSDLYIVRNQDNEYVLRTEGDVSNRVGKEKNLKSFYNSKDFDEFSDFNDEFEKEEQSKLDALNTNGKNQFANFHDAEFSSSGDTEFSSINDGDFP